MGPGAASSPQSPGAPDKGAGNFVGITKYLNANKPQAAKLGDQASGVINSSAQSAREGVNSLNQEASEKIKGVVGLDSNVTQKLQNNAEDLTADERQGIKKTQTATYQGPQDETGLSGYQAANKATQTATQNIDNSGTESGRMQLISQINNKPRTQGMNVFDNILLQAGGGRERLAQSASQNQDVKGALDQSAQNIRAQIGRSDDPSTPDIDESSGAMGQTDKARTDAYKSVQDALNAWKTGFQPKVQEAQNNLVNQQNRITGDLGDNQLGLDQETMDLLGLSEGQDIYGLNLADYLNNPSVADINAGNVATSQDYARYAALAELAGDTSGILNPANASMAGTAPALQADRAKLAADMQARNQAYQNAYTGNAAAIEGQLGQRMQGFMNTFAPSNPGVVGQSLDWFENNYQPSSNPIEVGQWNALQSAIRQWKEEQRVGNKISKNPAQGAS